MPAVRPEHVHYIKFSLFCGSLRHVRTTLVCICLVVGVIVKARCKAWAYTRQPLMLQQKMQFDSIYISCDPPCSKLCTWSRGTWCLPSSLTLSHSIIRVSKRPLLADVYRLPQFVFLTTPHVARVYRGKFVLLYRWWTKCESINFNHLSLGGFTGLFGSASRFDIISV